MVEVNSRKSVVGRWNFSASLRLCIALLFLAVAAPAQWVKQTVNTTANFRGLSVVNEKVIWASGTDGTVIRTIDGGKSWKVMTVPDAEKLDFRDIEAFDQFSAYILSIGNGESSRIYKTTDGGKTWKLEFKNTNEKAFFDAIACSDSSSCVAMSDPVDGSFLLLNRSSGPLKRGPKEIAWEQWRKSELPEAKEGEAAFAASGTCLIGQGVYKYFIVTGGSDARVFRNSNGARNLWSVSNTPIVKGTPGSGIFSIAMYDLKNGIIVGGNYEKPNEINNNLAFTTDGGETWKLSTGLTGYRSGATYVDKNTIITVGTNGSDMTRDGGKNWSKVGSEDLNAVQAKGKGTVWAVGPNGMVVRMKH